MTNSALPFLADTTNDLEDRLSRYERIRPSFALPFVQVTRAQAKTELLFQDYPSAVNLQSVGLPTLQDALRFLVKVESEWGVSLLRHVAPQELARDKRRGNWALGPCFFRQEPIENDIRQTLLGRLQLDLPAVDSFMDIAMGLAAARPADFAKLGLELDEEDRIRWFLQKAREHQAARDWSIGLDFALDAWRLRVGDLTTGTLCLDLASRCPDRADAQSIASLLAARPSVPPALARSLSKYHRKRHAPDIALQFAQVATADGSQASWKELVRAGDAAGDQTVVIQGLAALGGLGNEGAMNTLNRLVQRGTYAHAQWESLLFGWPRPVTDNIFLWRLEANTRLEKLEEVLLAVADAPPRRLLILKEKHIQAVLEASNRLGRGYLQRTLGALRESAHSSDATPALVQGFAALCLHQHHFSEVLSLDERHPGVLNPRVVMQAYGGQQQWTEMLELATAHRDPCCQLEASVRLSFQQGTKPERRWLRGLLQSGDHVTDKAHQLLDGLGATGGDQPVVRQLRSVLEST